jgi:hypothetical protein
MKATESTRMYERDLAVRLHLQDNWFPKGQQRKIPTHGKHQGAKLFSAIAYETEHVVHREEEMCTAIAFQRFPVDLLLVRV